MQPQLGGEVRVPFRPPVDREQGAGDALFVMISTGSVWHETLSSWARRRMQWLVQQGYAKAEQEWCPWSKNGPGLAVRYVLVKPVPREFMARSFAHTRQMKKQAVRRPGPAPHGADRRG